MFKVLKIDGPHIVTDKGCVIIMPFQYADGGKTKPIDDDTLHVMRNLFLASPKMLSALRHVQEFLRLTKTVEQSVFGRGRRNETLEEAIALVSDAIVAASGQQAGG